ncbi:MAG: hypothetical protein FJ147_22985 [Deltaproteobacteria bacterium]|nr:hypothetical protein [Deltaproteobacteria bacterium]
MYTEYFGFHEEPFADITDLRFFYTNAIYQRAYTTLLSGIREFKGFLLLTGEAGTGKTTVLRRVMQDLESAGHYLFFDSTSLTCSTIDDLLYFICAQLGLPKSGAGPAEKIRALTQYLTMLGGGRKQLTAIVIDRSGEPLHKSRDERRDHCVLASV